MTAPTMTVSLECRTCDGVRPVDRRTYECRFCGTVCDPTARKGLPPLAPVEAPVVAEQPDIFGGPLSLAPVTPPSNGTPTSDAAADSLSDEEIGAGHRRILNALWKARPGGLTDLELEANTGMGGSTTRPRRGELVTLGWVEDSGSTRATASGRQAVVWRLSLAARQVAARTPKRAEAA